ncbi:tubulin-specific chaperone A-like [Biomphalaria glabrata]|uniref:Tubulin-specific chaperone A n=1 Tax=Biomphalaria glabrata TaxID=6526 RepID=A0A9W2ZT19_BIOGL|nr:tubulin-specific chaperone A-like [Biomphalaria glabrata]KAI8755843.1 tubulin-specific chaperone A [Biomphalaria glabrata]
MADPRIKQIKIKTGVVKRLTKEKESYEKEAVQLEEKLEKMKADGKDEHDIRKQGEVLQESRSMVPDTVRRLKKAYAELEELLEKESDLSEVEEFTQAKEALKLAEPIVA